MINVPTYPIKLKNWYPSATLLGTHDFYAYNIRQSEVDYANLIQSTLQCIVRLPPTLTYLQ